MGVVLTDPEDVDGDFPKWILIYVPIAVTTY